MRITHRLDARHSLVRYLATAQDGRQPPANPVSGHVPIRERTTLSSRFSRDELVARIVRAGELEVSGDHPEEVGSYFDVESFAFHGPDGFESGYAGLTEYFASVRDAFDDRTIRRGIVVAEGNLIACQTWIEGTFVRPFTHSPAGRLEPNGARVVMDLINIFRLDDEGRLVEEFVRTDDRSLLRQLGADEA